jgi:hypothetical protein
LGIGFLFLGELFEETGPLGSEGGELSQQLLFGFLLGGEGMGS